VHKEVLTNRLFGYFWLLSDKNMNVLTIQQLKKSYGPIQALKSFSLEIPAGSVYGILGPNGSGKTTMLSILTGILNADSGDFNWFNGEQAETARKRIGAIIETPNFYPYLSAVDNLKIVAKIKDVDESRIEVVLNQVGLLERKNSAFKTYSLGMKQRLSLASCLLADPEVLVLDEPTNGLDPQGIAEIRNIILDVAKQGKTIIIASHILAEVQKICNYVAILRKGELLTSGTIAEVLSTEGVIEVSADNMEKLTEALKVWTQGGEVVQQNGSLKVVTTANPAELNKYLFDKGIVANKLVQYQSDLEEEFLKLVNA